MKRFTPEIMAAKLKKYMRKHRSRIWWANYIASTEFMLKPGRKKYSKIWRKMWGIGRRPLRKAIWGLWWLQDQSSQKFLLKKHLKKH